MSGSGSRVDARVARDGGSGDHVISTKVTEDLVSDLESLVDSERTEYDYLSEVVRDLIYEGLRSHPNFEPDGEGD